MPRAGLGFALACTLVLSTACGGGESPGPADVRLAARDRAAALHPVVTSAGAVADTPAGPGVAVDALLGDDSGPGTVERPFRTLARLASVRLAAGQGIHLRCGRVWRESLVLDARHLQDGAVIAGYGPCAEAKARISAADDVSGGWVRVGNVWQRAVPAGWPKVTRVFVDGQPHRVAQWPNADAAGRAWALNSVQAPVSATTLVVGELDRAALGGRSVVGAQVVARTEPWFIDDRVRVAAHDVASGRLTLDRPADHPLHPAEGYLLRDQRWMLDAPGEFFHDVAAGRLYLRPRTAAAQADLNAVRVEASVRDVALRLSGRQRLQVRDLQLDMARVDGVQTENTPGIVLASLDASNNERRGVWASQYAALPAGLRAGLVRDGSFRANGEVGLDLQDAVPFDALRNRVADTGMRMHVGMSKAGIRVGAGAVVEFNTVSRTAGTGIRFVGKAGARLHGNRVEDFCQRLADCGGLYTWNGFDDRTAMQSQLRANVVLRGVPDTAGSVGGGAGLVAGIYLDELATGVHVVGNTVADVPTGIFLHDASGIRVEANRVWRVGHAAYSALMNASDGQDHLRDNDVFDNQWIASPRVVAQATGQPVFEPVYAMRFSHGLLGATSITSGLNRFWGNRIVHLAGAEAPSVALAGPGTTRTLTSRDWVAMMPGEAAPTQPAEFQLLMETLGPELVPNGGFDAGSTGWGSWFATGGGSFRVVSGQPGCSGPCGLLKSATIHDTFYSAGFPLVAGRHYRLRYGAQLDGPGTVGLPKVGRASAPFDALTGSGGLAGVSATEGAAGSELRIVTYFTASASATARLNFGVLTAGLGAAFDDVSVREVLARRVSTPADWTAVVAAPPRARARFACVDLGWPEGCQVADADGRAVAMPVLLEPGEARLLLQLDSPWKP